MGVEDIRVECHVHSTRERLLETIHRAAGTEPTKTTGFGSSEFYRVDTQNAVLEYEIRCLGNFWRVSCRVAVCQGAEADRAFSKVISALSRLDGFSSRIMEDNAAEFILPNSTSELILLLLLPAINASRNAWLKMGGDVGWIVSCEDSLKRLHEGGREDGFR